jgi:capsular polysaccharide biosynthesis protein
VQYEQQEQELDLREIIHILTVRWWIIAIFTALSIIITGFVTFTMIDPVYKAEKSLLLEKKVTRSRHWISVSSTSIKPCIDYRQLILTAWCPRR